MQGASRESLSAATERLDMLLSSLSTDSSDTESVDIGGELFSVGALLDAQPSLRSALTDPSRSGDDKSELVQSLLGGKVAEQIVDLLGGMARSRWSAPRDLADAASRLGVEAVLVSAQRQDRLDQVQEQLFDFAGIVAAQPGLRRALTDRGLPADRKAELLTDLLASRTTVEAARLIEHVVTQPRGRSLESNLDELAQAAAARRERQVATVTSALPLSDQQRTRLASVLAAQLGHGVQLNVVIDPDVVGGLRVAIGDEVIDGTVSNRLDDAQRRITS